MEWKCYKRIFSDTWIRSLKADTNLLISDTRIPGLHLRFYQPTRHITFYLGYMVRHTKIRRNLFLGKYGEIKLEDVRKNAIMYKQQISAVKDAYIPFYKGKFDPHITWMANVCFQIILALACVGIAMRQKSKRKEQEHDIDVMLEIEKLAKEHQLDATAAKKMLAIAPEIVKHMSEDSRVYFDMIMDGKVSTTDENFMNIASAVMAGHLQTHPEDLDRVMSVFDDKAISAELLNMYTQQNNRNSK